MSKTPNNAHPVLTFTRRKSGKEIASVDISHYPISKVLGVGMLGSLIEHEQEGRIFTYNVSYDYKGDFGGIGNSDLMSLVRDTSVTSAICFNLFRGNSWSERIIHSSDFFITPGTIRFQSKNGVESEPIQRFIPRLFVDKLIQTNALGSLVSLGENEKNLTYTLRENHRKGLLGINQRELSRLREVYDVYVSFEIS